MDRPPQVNVLTIGDTSDGPTVLIRQYCYSCYLPGYLGTEGEPDTRTCVVDGKTMLVDFSDISGYAGPAGTRRDDVDLGTILNVADAIIAVIEPAKPVSLAGLEDARFTHSKDLINREKANGTLTETAIVLLWHDEEARGMTEEEQRELGREVAESYAARAVGDVGIYFVHAFSGAGVNEAVGGTVARVIQRNQA